jgi:hypothetical protein
MMNDYYHSQNPYEYPPPQFMNQQYLPYPQPQPPQFSQTVIYNPRMPRINPRTGNRLHPVPIQTTLKVESPEFVPITKKEIPVKKTIREPVKKEMALKAPKKEETKEPIDTKTRRCFFYAANSKLPCSKGENCPFKHIDCISHMSTEGCPNGNNCKYGHPEKNKI